MERWSNGVMGLLRPATAATASQSLPETKRVTPMLHLLHEMLHYFITPVLECSIRRNAWPSKMRIPPYDACFKIHS
jgi:hypothetical protein